MDWIKLLFFVNLAVLNVFLVKASKSQKDILLKVEKTSLNEKPANSTQDEKETLHESPSEVIRFERPVTSREKTASVNKKSKDKSARGKVKNRGTKNVDDLAKEANWYSPVLTFTETPIGGYWQGVSEIIPHIGQTDFISPIPIIKSQAFINKPKLSTVQKNYPPIKNLEGRHAYATRENPEDYNSQEDHRYPESENHPGRGHGVHTETTHDYGRFLPVDYKSKIEKEAEALIKEKRAQNTTTTTTTSKPLISKESRQRTQGSYQRQPINTSFFHKGTFDDAYPFPEDEKNQDDQRYVDSSEEYPSQYSTYAPKAPVTAVAVEEPYSPRPPITSTETYQQQYNYPTEHSPQHNHHDKDSHYINSHNQDLFYKSPPRKNSHYRSKNHGSEHHKDPNINPHNHYHISVHNKGPQHEDPHHKSQYYTDATPKTTHYKTQNPRDPYKSEVSHKYHQHRNFHHRNPSSGEYHHTGPPDAPAQYDSSTEKYSPTNPDTFQKPLSPYSGPTPHSPHHYNQPEEFHPHHYNDGKEHMPQFNSDLNQPVHQTNPPPTEYQQPYSDIHPKPPISHPDPSQHTKDSTLNQPPSGPLPKTPQEEKAYYNTVKSLVDLYKSFGLQPFNIDDVPYMLSPKFAFGNTFDGKIEVSGPAPNTRPSEDFMPNHKVQSYTENKNIPRDQNSNNYRKPYTSTNYNGQENERNPALFKHAQPDRNKYFPHHEQTSYYSNREPTISSEHYDSSESPRPDITSTQGEAPKESYLGGESDIKHHSDSQNNEFSHPNGEKIQGIRIKDYDPKTFFSNPQQNNYDSSRESDFISSVSHSDEPKHPHPIVRQNPYNTYTEEVRTTFRPRVYRQKLQVQSTPSVPYPDSVEKTHDFRSSAEVSEFSPPNDAYNSPHTFSNSPRDNRQFDPTANNYGHDEYNSPISKRPQKENEQWRPESERKYRFQQNENDRHHGYQENRHNRRKKTSHNHNRKKNYESDSHLRQTEQRSKSYKDSDIQQKRHGKRSNHRHPRNLKIKKKSHGDQLRAEGSSYHWGREKHKGTDGFFQYANVPGAKWYEYGYRMGGPNQTRETHHQTFGLQSKIKVNWEDKNGDTGDHYWEYNHNSEEMEEDSEEQKIKSEENLKEESQERDE